MPKANKLTELLSQLKIDNWDMLLIGDGSGSNWEWECGWGCISIEKEGLEFRKWYGAFSKGTVNVAEMMAYVHPLCWYLERELKIRKEQKITRVRHVHIITDSAYVAEGGKNKSANLANSPLWSVFRSLEAHGIKLEKHWIPRNSCSWNALADQLSKVSRETFKNTDIQQIALDRFTVESSKQMKEQIQQLQEGIKE
jgi:ribonuclease HI